MVGQREVGDMSLVVNDTRPRIRHVVGSCPELEAKIRFIDIATPTWPFFLHC